MFSIRTGGDGSSAQWWIDRQSAGCSASGSRFCDRTRFILHLSASVGKACNTVRALESIDGLTSFVAKEVAVCFPGVPFGYIVAIAIAR
jgi:hypothetical protein